VPYGSSGAHSRHCSSRGVDRSSQEHRNQRGLRSFRSPKADRKRLHPHSEHILDWFHIGMRVEQLSQTARGFSGTYESGMTKEKVLKELERVKWFLWHGNLFLPMRR
jgi:hypothetical protein